MTLAVIKTGGKQYLVKKGDRIRIEKLNGPASAGASAFAKATADKSVGKKEITFTDVLLVSKERKVEIGAPLIKGAKVHAKILEQGKGEKVIIFKYKPKKRYKKKAGHRQPYTEIEIKEIVLDGKEKTVTKKPVKKPAKKKVKKK